jgi:Nuclease-related domain
MYQPQHRKEFAPWRAEFRLMIFYWIVTAIWFGAAIVWCVRAPSLESKAVAEGAVFPLFFGLLYFESARRRRHGSLVEKRAVKRFRAAAPSDWLIKDDTVHPKLGNIDLVVRFPDGRQFPIEIKSWRSAGNPSRQMRALEQVRRQCETLRVHNGVVWLPEAAKRKVFSFGDILLIEGNEHFLIRRLADRYRPAHHPNFVSAPAKQWYG